LTEAARSRVDAADATLDTRRRVWVADGALTEAKRGDVGDVAVAAISGRALTCEDGEVVRTGKGIDSSLFGGVAEVIVEGRNVGLLFRNGLVLLRGHFRDFWAGGLRWAALMKLVSRF
jgi:hypothetical protein